MEMVNCKKVFALLIEMGNVGDEIGRSKDWAQMSRLIDEVMQITSVEWDKIDDEYKSGDMEEFKAWFKDKFDIVDDKLESLIEQGFVVLLGMVEILRLLRK